nr:diaminopimelate epimerase [Bacteroidota bacterium]
MKVAFYKFHGTGNDFILIDLTKISLSFTKKDISDLCDRHFGIGADGLILLRSTAMCDFHMQYFNSDGKEGTMCGNGGRCTVAFAQLMGVIDQSARFIAIDGVHTGEVISMHSNIYNIRLQLNNTEMPEIINDGYLINTGSPHFVKFVENNQEVDVVEEGRKIRNRRDLWPDGVNVNFVSVSDGGINVRTYERGVENETLSCGTGVT